MSTFIPNLSNIEDVNDRSVAGKALDYRFWLLPVLFVDRDKKFPKPNMNREISSIPLKEGKSPKFFEAHSIPGYGFEASRGDNAMNGNHSFTALIGGFRKEVLDFIENWGGAKFILFYQECGDDTVFMVGSACKPMVLTDIKGGNDNDGRLFTFTFKSESMAMPLIYTGSQLKSGDATQSVSGTATDLAIKSGADVYVIVDGTSSSATIATVSGLTTADKGRTVTIVGNGVSHPSNIKSNTVFILENAKQWDAKKGAEIVFRILSKNQLIEVSRIEA